MRRAADADGLALMTRYENSATFTCKIGGAMDALMQVTDCVAK